MAALEWHGGKVCCVVVFMVEGFGLGSLGMVKANILWAGTL